MQGGIKQEAQLSQRDHSCVIQYITKSPKAIQNDTVE